MNEPYAPPSALPQPGISDPPTSNSDTSSIPKEKKGTIEEEGGKLTAGEPSKFDKGALEMGGEAGGTHTSPGPSAGMVKEYLQRQQGGLGGVTGEEGDGQVVGEGSDGWRVEGRMEPHLQMM